MGCYLTQLIQLFSVHLLDWLSASFSRGGWLLKNAFRKVHGM